MLLHRHDFKSNAPFLIGLKNLIDINTAKGFSKNENPGRHYNK